MELEDVIATRAATPRTSSAGKKCSNCETITKRAAQRIQELKVQIDKEKRSHTEANNAIIRANARLQASLDETAQTARKLSNDREELVLLVQLKEREIEGLKAEAVVLKKSAARAGKMFEELKTVITDGLREVITKQTDFHQQTGTKVDQALRELLDQVKASQKSSLAAASAPPPSPSRSQVLGQAMRVSQPFAPIRPSTPLRRQPLGVLPVTQSLPPPPSANPPLKDGLGFAVPAPVKQKSTQTLVPESLFEISETKNESFAPSASSSHSASVTFTNEDMVVSPLAKMAKGNSVEEESLEDEKDEVNGEAAAEVDTPEDKENVANRKATNTTKQQVTKKTDKRKKATNQKSTSKTTKRKKSPTTKKPSTEVQQSTGRSRLPPRQSKLKIKSLADPSLNCKLRQGDPHTFTLKERIELPSSTNQRASQKWKKVEEEARMQVLGSIRYNQPSEEADQQQQSRNSKRTTSGRKRKTAAASSSCSSTSLSGQKTRRLRPKKLHNEAEDENEDEPMMTNIPSSPSPSSKEEKRHHHPPSTPMLEGTVVEDSPLLVQSPLAVLDLPHQTYGQKQRKKSLVSRPSVGYDSISSISWS
ncbi:hypothetical protein QOT17_001554 [Balamuthia mandrillaris]